MNHLLIGRVALLILAMVTTDAIAQKGRGNGGGQGRGSGGSGIQTRAGQPGQASRFQRGNQGAAAQLGYQVQQASGVSATKANSPDLLRMREEEKLARDVYASLAKTSKLTIFRNISRAESQHMRSIERLIRSAGANAVPLDDTPGMFVFPEYQQLYTTLIASGTRSPLDALLVGAKIEEMDISDLRGMLTQTTDQQARQVLERLLQGSHNHLRAFAAQLAGRGASYDAEFLTQADFDQIASGAGHGQQSAGRSGTNRGQGSPAHGQQFGPQFQAAGGQGFGPQYRSRQGGAQGAGRQGGGGTGQGGTGQGRTGRGRS
jgi:hypothetical protein